MSLILDRRELLAALAATAALPICALAAAPPRPSVAIVGAGMSGVSLAWLLDGAFDVTLIEAHPSIGGNVQTVDVELDGSQFAVDLGAQYFHPALYPLYSLVLQHLGLGTPGSADPGLVHQFLASITVTAAGEPLPRFVSPVLPGRAWPLVVQWNAAGLSAFGIGFLAARIREQLRQSWDLTLGGWLPTLGLSQAQWEGMLLPWAASLFSGSVDQARGLSARAAMIFAAKALPPNPLDPIIYYALKPGMIEVLQRMLAECSTVNVTTGSPVVGVARRVGGGFTVHGLNRPPIDVDHLVLAASAPATKWLLEQLPGTAPQVAAMNGLEFHPALLALHTDPAYAPAAFGHRSFFNCEVEGAHCEASMWLAPVVPDTPATAQARLWKSWILHRSHPPAEILHQAAFMHMLPTPATLSAQEHVRSLQGLDGIWIAGGYLYPYDSQETALISALSVALGMQATTSRSAALAAAASISS
jgi:predicted NAD/FAD-binding protein